MELPGSATGFAITYVSMSV